MSTTRSAKGRLTISQTVEGDGAILRLEGALDETFTGFDPLRVTQVVLELGGLTRITSYGVRQWIRGRDQLSEWAEKLYYLNCPPFFIDQLNMVLNFGGNGRVLTAQAPFSCPQCHWEKLALIDVLRGHEALVSGAVPAQRCAKCDSLMELEELPETYFGFVRAAGARELSSAIAPLLQGLALYGAAAPPARAPAPKEDPLDDNNIGSEAAPEVRRTGGILGKYEIVRAISVGGMAEVFLAVQRGRRGFEKAVALKRIRRSILERRHLAIEQFLNEAKIAATLAHPNISQIFEVGEEQGLLYMAMEYVHGRDLRVVLRRIKERGEPMPVGVALYILRETARALHHAYTVTDLNGRQLKAVHRDVSPHNIVIAFDGNVKLIDFGVATSALTGHDSTQVAGKYNYMSPEQLQGGPPDPRSDLFSLGVVLYEMVVGERPFAHESRDETLAALSEVRFRPASQRRNDLPLGFDQLLGKLLARSPSSRFSDGSKVAEAAAAFSAKHNLAVSAGWLSASMNELFPTLEELTDPDGEQTSSTPRSDSFSLEPTFTRARAASPSLAALSSASLLDEDRGSQAIRPTAGPTRLLIVATVVLLILAALVWAW